MARPQKNKVDYFPFICNEGASTNFIENKYQNEGFATWVKILRELAKTDYHYLDLTVRKNVLNITAKCHVTEERFFEIVNDLCDLEEFNRELWINEKVIWSQQFIVNIEEAYLKRKNKILDLAELKENLPGFRGNKLLKSDQNSVKNTQSIVYNNIGDNSILLEEKKIEKSEVIFLTKEEEEEKKNQLLTSQLWIESSCMQLKISDADFKKRVSEFFDEIRNTGDLRKSVPELQKFYFYWIRKKSYGSNNKQGSTSGTAKVIRPKGFNGL